MQESVRDRVNMLSQVNEVEKQNKSTFFSQLINMMTMIFCQRHVQHIYMNRSQSPLNNAV